MEEKEKAVKVLFIGDLVTPTGFSTVSHGIIDNLDKKFSVAGLGVNYFGDPHQYSYPIFPAKSGMDVYGIKRLDALLPRLQPDIIFILNDIWMIDKYLEKIKEHYEEKKEVLPKIVIYFPIDAKEHDADWYKNTDIVSRAATYTEFGRSVVEQACPVLPIDIIPHGVDTTYFHQMFSNRQEAKKHLFKGKLESLTEDSFIFLNAGRNQPRKKLDITLRAFKLFSENKPENVKIYMHCGIIDGGHIDVIKYAQRLGIRERLLVTNVQAGPQNVTKEFLNLIYNATDVGLNSGTGEGWSLPNMEHAVTGAPQIVAGHSALKEIYNKCGLLVPVKEDILIDKNMTMGGLISPEDLAIKMEEVYVNRNLHAKLSKLGQEKFLLPEYQWANIGKSWSQLLNEVL